MAKIDQVLDWLDDEHGGDTDAATAFGLICELRDENHGLRRALKTILDDEMTRAPKYRSSLILNTVAAALNAQPVT